MLAVLVAARAKNQSRPEATDEHLDTTGGASIYGSHYRDDLHPSGIARRIPAAKVADQVTAGRDHLEVEVTHPFERSKIPATWNAHSSQSNAAWPFLSSLIASRRNAARESD